MEVESKEREDGWKAKAMFKKARAVYDKRPFPEKQLERLRLFKDKTFPPGPRSLRTSAGAWQELIAPIDKVAASFVVDGVDAEKFMDGRQRTNNPRSYQDSMSDSQVEVLEKKLKKSENWKEVESAEVERWRKDGSVIFHPVFLVRKKVEGPFDEDNPDHWREVLNCKRLNAFTEYQKFKLEDLSSVAETAEEGDFMLKFDLKDGYFLCPLKDSSEKLFVTKHNGKFYRPTGLVFGWSPAPRVFTRLMKGPIKLLRSMGIRCVIYLDDILIMAPRDKIIQHGEAALSLLTKLGFRLSWAKCELSPFQRGTFLGAGVDTVLMMFFVPEVKKKKLAQNVKNFIKRVMKKSATARDLSRLIGKLVALKRMILPTMLFLRRPCRDLSLHLADFHYDDRIEVSEETLLDLEWWKLEIRQWSGKAFLPPLASKHYRTDASDFGWGVEYVTGATRTGGQFSAEEAEWHINEKELLAIWYAMMAADDKDCVIFVEVDNTSAMSHANKGGGRSQRLSELTRKMWEWCLERNILLYVDWIAGVDNVVADAESRREYDSNNWKLHPRLFADIVEQFGLLKVDMFASYVNRQVEVFWSERADPYSAQVDAFKQDWSKVEGGYLHPPYHLIGKALRKVKDAGGVQFILVAPVWESRPWWPLLLELLLEAPRLLPREEDTFLPESTSNRTGVGRANWEAAVFRVGAGGASSPISLKRQWLSSMHQSLEER